MIEEVDKNKLDNGLDGALGGVPPVNIPGCSGDDDDFDPDAIKKEIDDFIAKHGGHLTLADAEHLMLLLQEFLGAKVGVDAKLQKHMSKYMAELKELWSLIDEGNSKDHKDDTNLDKQFNDKMNALMKELKNDPFFDTSDKKSVRDTILNSLKSVSGLINNTSLDHGKSHIFNFWCKADPTLYWDDPTSNPPQGDPTGINSLTRMTTAINQEVMGQSQAVGAITQADERTWQSGFNTLNNLYKTDTRNGSSIIRNFITH